MRHRILASSLIWLALASQADAQFGSASENGIKFDQQVSQRWKVGIIIRAIGGASGGIYGTVPVPTDWPEQSVKIVDEEITQHVRSVRYRALENGVKQMLVTIPLLNAGETATALVTFEVTKSSVLPPDDPARFVLPARPPREVRPYLGSSPYIESRHNRIRSLSKQLVKGKEGAWEQVEAIYDWVRDNVEYKNGELKGALAALRDGDGDCEELTSLFIALCRANRIPARTVWVPGHCYPEFFLLDQDGKGHWIPCQAAGTRDFGGMPDHRPILQKGDNFKVPEKKEAQRYVAEFLKVQSVRGAGRPEVQFVRELLPAE